MKNSIIYAIGDVHGRYDLLVSIVQHSIADAELNNSKPRFIFLGDICDKGPRSHQCLDLVAEVLNDFPGSLMLRGNHDDLFLKALQSDDRRLVAQWLARGGIETLTSYYRGELTDAIELVRTSYADHLRLIEQCQPAHTEDGLVFAHAGITPNVPFSRQTEHDLMWIRKPFLDHVGYMDKVVIHGHSVVGDLPVVTENRISIDTGAYASGRLTAVAVQNGSYRFFQTNGKASEIIDVEPIKLDRGLGTVLDSQDQSSAIFKAAA